MPKRGYSWRHKNKRQLPVLSFLELNPDPWKGFPQILVNPQLPLFYPYHYAIPSTLTHTHTLLSSTFKLLQKLLLEGI
jgi:hypothetical protein